MGGSLTTPRAHCQGGPRRPCRRAAEGPRSPVNMPLATPVTHEGKVYTWLRLRNPGRCGIDKAARQPGYTSAEVAFLALCAGVPFEVIAEIDAAEYDTIVTQSDLLLLIGATP